MADERAASDMTWMVGGHRWTVTERSHEPGRYDITWVSGRDPGYGFTLGSSTRRPISDAVIRREIANFLAGIDPDTGHLA